MFVTALDGTVAVDSDEVKSGSKTEHRPFTEYWTFVRPTEGGAKHDWGLDCIETVRSFRLT